MVWACLLIAIVMSLDMTMQAPLAAASANEERAWKVYTNARFGFSVRYPENWRLGNPISEGIGVTLYPPIDNSLVALSGHMNVLEGKSQDGRQTLDEFAAAHRRIITELYDKKTIIVKWRQDQEMSLAGFPAKQLTFTYTGCGRGTRSEPAESGDGTGVRHPWCAGGAPGGDRRGWQTQVRSRERNRSRTSYAAQRPARHLCLGSRQIRRHDRHVGPASRQRTCHSGQTQQSWCRRVNDPDG